MGTPRFWKQTLLSKNSTVLTLISHPSSTTLLTTLKFYQFLMFSENMFRRDRNPGRGQWGADSIQAENNKTQDASRGFPDGSDGKGTACSAGDVGLIPQSGRSPEEGIGYPPPYSCLENPMDRGTSWATVHGEPKSWTRLSNSLAWEDGGAKYVQGYQRKEMKQVVRAWPIATIDFSAFISSSV